MEEDGMRERSFCDEDYDTRRVFFRIYPLHWDPQTKTEESFDHECSKKEPARVANKINGKKTINKTILVFRRVKRKITIFVVNCVPVSSKSPTPLISVI
ncbi:hypothetical protein PHJA_002905900 [Phtheirospermum japonicum]|uniref:Uncharacterized protein n=1 Tax=Phtheirospermum japonicum TaxID=374723 RepID=A0A830D4X9_9LAMI|nr:hypothetical protein PHJA_002905900 [Phtheirospermum japonicum]